MHSYGAMLSRKLMDSGQRSLSLHGSCTLLCPRTDRHIQVRLAAVRTVYVSVNDLFCSSNISTINSGGSGRPVDAARCIGLFTSGLRWQQAWLERVTQSVSLSDASPALRVTPPPPCCWSMHHACIE